MIALSAAVEGLIDEAVLLRICELAKVNIGTVYGKRGKNHLRKKIAAYTYAAQYTPWIVLVDLNQEANCAPELCKEWLPIPSPHMNFRIAVRSVEAWLLSDREKISNFLRVSSKLVPLNPERESDPKQTIVNLARRSKSRVIRKDIVPKPSSGRRVGPAYTARMIEFAMRYWRPEQAAKSSESLCRCLNVLRILHRRGA